MTEITLNRRHFLQAGAGLGAGIIASGLPLSQAVWAAEGKVLKARDYSHIDKLDPDLYQNAYNVDGMDWICTKLTRYKTGPEWGWEVE
ncbi:twin-arginine translocation signal domain-containing protein, partial [Mesorhizobium sp. M7A.F.Ca.CA.002.05.1.1]|uniref:twin-arginine translocation signal domain-containing protein n=1 Tax=Mesorhizobium sp. M7A.F.Ca.CA.002.05.1.1 TaxID=2496704 RepID=UPI0013DFCFB2